jgi:phosphatidylglycerophosphatase C
MCSHQEKPVVAVFDFDGTLTYKHTFWRFLKFSIGSLRFSGIVIRLLPVLVKLAFGKISLMDARELLIYYCLKNFPEEKLQQLGQQFATEKIPTWLRTDGMQRLQWHKTQGHRTILVSNSAEYYLQPWAQTVGFNEVLGSKFDVRSGLLTGRLLGTHCQGEEKVNRLKALLEDITQYRLYVYGDSSGDQEMLAIAYKPYYRTFQDTQTNV